MASEDSLGAYYLGRLSVNDFAASLPSPLRSSPEEDDLPLLDFSAFADHSTRPAALLQLSKAAEEWGFFRLINHNIPHYLLQRMQSHALHFFNLPFHHKLNASHPHSQPTTFPSGYRAGSSPSQSVKWWNESLNFSGDGADFGFRKVMRKVWLDDDEERYQEFSKDVEEYIEKMQALSHGLRKLLTECLGLTPSYWDETCEKETDAGLRFFYYPPCPQPDFILGLPQHTDPGLLTIFHYNHTPGLQIEKDGEWIGVKPQIGSLLINIGDLFQVLSNGRFKATLHRVVVNKDAPKLSILFFYNARKDAIIEPASPLVNNEHPPLYRPTTWREHKAYFLAKESITNTLEYLKR